MSSTRRILIYSPDLEGHPRVYCRVVADALVGGACELRLILGYSERIGFSDCPDLWPLAGRPGVELVDARTLSATGSTRLSAEELLSYQSAESIDTTLFVEGDKSEYELRRIAVGEALPLAGRNLAIFANTAEWYPGEDSYSGQRLSWRAPTLRTTLGNLKRALLHRRRTRRYFFEELLLRRRVLQEVLVKDERLADWYGPPVHWMPEISRPASEPEGDEDRLEIEIRRRELAAFLESNKERERLLYFGDPAPYKGYDLLLEFMLRRPEICLIHAGRSLDEVEGARFEIDIGSHREQLLVEGRLLETHSYVHLQRLKELYFRAVRLYVTTHRLALSSSTMIQACEFGRPVLVPDRGLLGHRVRKHAIGGTYCYGDLDDLERQAGRLWASDLSRFEKATRAFWTCFSDDAIRRFFQRHLLDV